MLEAQSKPKRSYVLYILFIFLSSLLILVDYFSNKEISSYIPKSLTFEFNLNVFESTYIDSFNSLLTSRAEIVSENIRLEQEVKNLRALEIEISSLKEKIESFENISLIKNFNNLNFIETSLIIKNSSNEFLISGGTNQNFQNGDLVIDDRGYVVGYLREVLYSYSILETFLSPNFKIQLLDTNNNEYLLTSDGSQLYLSSINIRAFNSDIDFLFTDISYNHSGKFPVVDIRTINFELVNNQINSSFNFSNIFTFNTQLYIPKPK
jgi:hypothetical protein